MKRVMWVCGHCNTMNKATNVCTKCNWNVAARRYSSGPWIGIDWAIGPSEMACWLLEMREREIRIIQDAFRYTPGIKPFAKYDGRPFEECDTRSGREVLHSLLRENVEGVPPVGGSSTVGEGRMD